MALTIKRTSFNGLYTILLVGLLVSIFLPILSNVRMAVLCVLIIGFGIMMDTSILSNRAFWCTAGFFVVQVFYALFGKGIPMVMAVSNGLFFFTGIVVTFNLKLLSRKSIRILMIVLVLFLLFELIGSFVLLLQNPMLLRQLRYTAGSDPYVEEMLIAYRYRGLISYGIGEALSIITPALLAFGLHSRKAWASSLFYGLTLFSIVVQMLGALTTSFFLTIVFCLFVLFSKVNFSIRRSKIGVVVLISILVVVSVLFVRPLFERNSLFFSKVEDVGQTISGDESDGQVEGRFDLMKQSLNVCLHNPILGLGDYPASAFDFTEKTVSLHAGVFDYWGLYGVFVLLLFFSWRDTSKIYYLCLDEEKKKCYRWCFLSLLLLLFLKGPVTISINYLFSTIFLGLLMLSDYYRTKPILEQ